MLHNEVSDRIVQEVTNRLKKERISLEEAKNILHKAEVKAKSIKVPVVIAVVDDGGNLIAQHKMDEAPIASIAIAYSKAYTAIALKKPTQELSKVVGPGQPLYGLENMCNGKLCTFGGGIPMTSNGKVIGGIGVSGGSIEEDVLIASEALKTE
ncbi:uncharacterized protein GlcG (DUF336 family) [Natranaerovirga hydrolytica]|uniref:Uncharacterized protein GlcG (DUF336 family) n=1 Tax=Natranaerovirga hydrolytica TaxID=680378 RepID=A0A4R1M6X9_9FIRM|nr:heme-binding protein [Natranaerovirga hydrolytica]TCK88038.1 uncharacterized protein GlcG (DUF336 family) [Natranaerovirga hydrolytica]